MGRIEFSMTSKETTGASVLELVSHWCFCILFNNVDWGQLTEIAKHVVIL